MVIVRDDNGAEVETYSDSVHVYVGDDVVLPEENLTAVIDMSDKWAAIRLSGRAGLQRVDANEAGRIRARSSSVTR
jgi:hypothetical protein